MKPNEWVILSRAIEEGVAYGWNRAHKHIDDPSPEAIRSEIEQAVENSISEVFVFEEDDCEGID